MSEVDVKYLRWLRRLSVVPRWSVVPTLRKQNVATHSYYVTCIALMLLGHHNKGEDKEFCLSVLKLALTHDINEAAEGDAPSPSKKATMTRDQVYVVMKVADILEAYMFVQEEMGMGNAIGTIGLCEDLENRLHPWFIAFDWKYPVTMSSLLEMVRMVVYSTSHPHPALESEPCFPLK